MTKDEILARSREENKNMDYAEMEFRTKSHTVGTVTSLLVCLVLYILKIFLGFGQDYGLYAVIMLNSGAAGMYMYFKTKDKKHLPMGILWSIIGITAAVVSVAQLVKTSPIL